MGLTMRERHANLRQTASRYRRASKKARSEILNEFVQLTGYSRAYAAYALRNCGRREVRMIGQQRVIFVVGQARPVGARRDRSRCYGDDVLKVLKRLWVISDGLCGKRLVAFIREALPILERCGEITLSGQLTRGKLLRISPATVDRLLAPLKARMRFKTRSHTRPGTLLKHHIPIRTFAQWNEQRPGFLEVDLVAHDGGAAWGEYVQTLNATDVATGWTEPRAAKNKAQCHVFEALKTIRGELPFPLLGIDSDNGGEFINNELSRYCELNAITFTRSRPYRKNDNCFVEQKNYSIVRKTVGYYRYDDPGQLALLGELYQALRLYTNFFQPVMKLREKTRAGSRLTRRYDQPKTPFRRLLDHPNVPESTKQALQLQYQKLNPAELKRSLDHLQDRLFGTAIAKKPPPLAPPRSGYAREDHPWRQTSPRYRYLASVSSETQNRKSPLDSKRKNHNTLTASQNTQP